MISEKEKQNREKLFKLMRKHPDLPVIPMVDGEIPGDDSGYWLGAWGNVELDEYLVIDRGERIVFKSDNDVFEVLEKQLTEEEFFKLPDRVEDCRPYYDALPWIKAIIVYITTA